MFYLSRQTRQDTKIMARSGHFFTRQDKQLIYWKSVLISSFMLLKRLKT